MEYPKDINVPIWPDEVSIAVMPREQDADTTVRVEISMAHLRILSEDLGTFKYALDSATRGFRVVRSDVLEDVLEPAARFVGPGYLRHDRMRRPISSFEMVRRASESARPR